ncbi:hypothetical protein UFOVP1454_35 [uncultured Caudovirales phage]|uniref:Uncharacterized protein n=1 Tax=uncultured Caudovirales phage TaxID=2100421 RepID=A0A6J5SIB0_9CAUD|nr:hypothetical protein UFOVP1454_35 [uncultured Caudovirales phage]
MNQKTLNEKDLNRAYSENGISFGTKFELQAHLSFHGFKPLNGSTTKFIDKKKRIGTVYPLRDAVLEVFHPHKLRYYTPRGFLLSFGGEPKSCYDLKITKISRPLN